MDHIGIKKIVYDYKEGYELLAIAVYINDELESEREARILIEDTETPVKYTYDSHGNRIKKEGPHETLGSIVVREITY